MKALKQALTLMVEVPIAEGQTSYKEIAIARLLASNSLIRQNSGLKPFFPPGNDPQYQVVMSNAVELDVTAWHDTVFVRSWMNAGQTSTSRHALCAVRNVETGVMTFIDSNGVNGPHANRLAELANRFKPGSATVANTKALQVGVQRTSLWAEGQVLARFLGWCSLWALCVCELATAGGLSLRGVDAFLNMGDNDYEKEIVLWVVRRASIRIFHRCAAWVRVNRPGSIELQMLEKLSNAVESVNINGRPHAFEVDEDVIYIGSKRRSHQDISKGESVYFNWKMCTGAMEVQVSTWFAPEDVEASEAAIRLALSTVLTDPLPPFKLWTYTNAAVYAYFPPTWHYDCINETVALSVILRQRYRGHPASVEWATSTAGTKQLVNLSVFNAEFRDSFLKRDAATGDYVMNASQIAKRVKPMLTNKVKPLRAFESTDLRVRLSIDGTQNGKELATTFGLDGAVGQDDVLKLLSVVDTDALRLLAPFAPLKYDQDRLPAQVVLVKQQAHPYNVASVALNGTATLVVEVMKGGEGGNSGVSSSISKEFAVDGNVHRATERQRRRAAIGELLWKTILKTRATK